MDNIVFWQNLWFFLVLAILGIYTLLDGFDLGIGIMLPFFDRQKREPAALLAFISPIWDGNEVWLITGVGSLFAVFPAAYAALLGGFYLPLIFTIFFFIFRAIAFGFWYHEPDGKRKWEIVFIADSFLASLFAMLAAGNLVAGLPIDSHRVFAGNLITFIRPLPVLFGISGVLILCLQGMAFTVFKIGGTLGERARKLCGILTPAITIFLFFTMTFIFIGYPAEIQKPGIWAGAAVSLSGLVLIRVFLKKFSGRSIFILSSLVIAGLWTAIGSILYPHLIRGIDPANSLSIFEASAPLYTLKLMALITVIGLAVVAFYTLVIYRIFFDEKSGGKTVK